MIFLKAFVVGGLLCVIAQLLIDYTAMTTSRILVTYVTAGVVLSALGWYQPLVDFAGAGATVPLLGFGHSLAQGALSAVRESGWMGAFTGGITATAAGITAAIVFGYAAALLFRPKTKP